MTENIHCLPVIQGFFLITTLLFILLSCILGNKVKHLRRKLSRKLEELAVKTKEVEELKKSPKSLLVPYDAEKSKSIIISIDSNGRLAYANDYAEEIFGFTQEELIGHSAFDTIFPAPEKHDAGNDIITRIFTNPKLYVEHETENVRKDGSKFWISWTNRVVYDENGNPSEIRSVGFDISKRKKLENELKVLSALDPVTNVLNRQAFLEAGAKELKRSNRYNRQLSVIVMKLTFFQNLGSEQLRTFTDEILQNVVQICRKSVRESDILGRIGDVEFGIILPETPQENAAFLSDRLKQKIQESALTAGGDFFISAIFGVAGKGKKDDSIDTLLLRSFNDLNKVESASRGKKTVRKKKGDK